MDAAANAVSKLLSGAGEHFQTKTEQSHTEQVKPAQVETAKKVEDSQVKTAQVDTKAEVASAVDTAATGEKDTTVDQTIAPAVEHETIKHEHETREQKVVDRERHQDHYHTTIQPLKDQQVDETKHTTEVDATQERQINKDKQGDQVKAKVAADQAAFKDTTVEAATEETKTAEPTAVAESVHHHLHETIQPVIEREHIVPEVTHKVKPVHEVVQEQTQNHGVTTRSAISVDEFQHHLHGESKTEVKHAGEPSVAESATTAVTEKTD
ncbi:hypothetical protein E4T48_01029 [Aureobasidium sp. EXF-10727]|nr:hypothetical protein E4T48_01029 [Aureobasidium sp. EXF-10727]